MKDTLSWSFVYVDDLTGHEDGLPAGRIGNRDFDHGAREILFFAFEAQTATRHILAGNDLVRHAGTANARLKFHSGARVPAAVCSARTSVRRRSVGGCVGSRAR